MANLRRFKLILQYDGSKYCGFQIQPNADSIEANINNALSQALDESIRVTACSRTDSGVHAYALVLHCDTTRLEFPIERLPFITPAYLPADIVVLSAEWVSNDFHARYSVVDKTYQYIIKQAKISSAFEHNRVYCYKHSVDVVAMQEAAQSLVGTHDYKAFMSSGSSATTTVRTIKSLKIDINSDKISISITANGFLYNMVRIIVGTLLDIGRGHLPQSTISSMIESGNRAIGGHTAPPQGLYLLSVNYEE